MKIDDVECTLVEVSIYAAVFAKAVRTALSPSEVASYRGLDKLQAQLEGVRELRVDAENAVRWHRVGSA